MFSLSPKAKYPAAPSCAPVAAAQSVFFPYSFGNYSGVRELGYDALTGNLQSSPVTDHVTKYIQGNVKQIVASVGYNMLFVRTDEELKDMYVYEWYDNGEEKLQSAWGTWRFAYDVLYVAAVDNFIYLIQDTGTDVVVTTIRLSDEDSEGVPFPIRLDMRQMITATPDVDNFLWTIDTDITDYETDILIIAGDDTGKAGLNMPYTTDPLGISGDFVMLQYESEYIDPVYVDASYTAVTAPVFWVGITYEADGVLTNPYVRGQNGEPYTDAELRLGTLEFYLSNTGYVKLYRIKGTDVFNKIYNSRVIDRTGINPDDPPDIQSVPFSIPVRASRSSCKVGFNSDDYTPFYITNVNWDGTFSTSGRRSN
jgi:hypothetical protein